MNWKRKDWILYKYDAVANMLESQTYRREDSDSIQISGISMNYNALNQVLSQTRSIYEPTDVTEPLKDYTTLYQYDVVGNMVRMKYPNSSTWLEYDYDQNNRLVNIPGFVEDAAENGFSYGQAGRLTDVRYANDVSMQYELDAVGRTSKIEVAGYNYDEAHGIRENSLNFEYTFDGVGNV